MSKRSLVCTNVVIYTFAAMHTVAEIEAAAKSLPQQQQEELLRRLENLVHISKPRVDFPVIHATGRPITQQELEDARDDN